MNSSKVKFVAFNKLFFKMNIWHQAFIFTLTFFSISNCTSNKHPKTRVGHEVGAIESSNDSITALLTAYLGNIPDESSLDKYKFKGKVDYDMIEGDDDVKRFCTIKKNGFVAVVTELVDSNLANKHSLEINGVPVELKKVIGTKTIEGYPFDIEGSIECEASDYYFVNRPGGEPCFLIVSNPLRWSGLMSANYLFYRLVDIKSKIGVQTVARIKEE